MLEVEVFGAELLSGPFLQSEVERLCALALASAGVEDGHLAVEFVEAERIGELNEEHRGKTGLPTCSPSRSTAPRRTLPAEGVPRELGDIVICPEHTEDVSEAIVHGALHLVGMDHETDDGEMLALQAGSCWTRAQPTQVDAAAAFVALAGVPTWASRRLSTRSWARRSRSSPIGPKRRGARSAASHRLRAQLVLVDLPGGTASPRRPHRAHGRPRARGARGLGRRPARSQRRAGGGPGDRYHRARAGRAQHAGDDRRQQGGPARPRRHCRGARRRPPSWRWARRFFPISARTGKGVPALVEHLAALMPSARSCSPAEAISDQPCRCCSPSWSGRPRSGAPSKSCLMQLRRSSKRSNVHARAGSGQGFDLGRERVPEGDRGRGRGRMIKAIGMAARKEIERELGCHVHLDLSVRVRRDWRGDEGAGSPRDHLSRAR